MPRKKKIEEVKEEEIIVNDPKKGDYGTGWSRKNNMIQAGIREEEKNE